MNTDFFCHRGHREHGAFFQEQLQLRTVLTTCAVLSEIMLQCTHIWRTLCKSNRDNLMANTATIKQQRMNIRLDSLSKQKLERAAAYSHKSLSEFVLGQALHAADEVIQEHETLTLTQADWDVFLEALENPPTPDDKLRHAFASHKKHVQR